MRLVTWFRMVHMLYTRTKHIMISARESENMSVKTFTILHVQAWKSNKFQITRFSASELVTFNDRVFLPKRHTKFSPEEQTTNMRKKRCQCSTQKGGSKGRWRQPGALGRIKYGWGGGALTPLEIIMGFATSNLILIWYLDSKYINIYFHFEEEKKKECFLHFCFSLQRINQWIDLSVPALSTSVRVLRALYRLVTAQRTDVTKCILRIRSI